MKQAIERDLDRAVGGEGLRGVDVGADDGEWRSGDDLVVLLPLVARAERGAGGADQQSRSEREASQLSE
jgi:hypothetical protein